MPTIPEMKEHLLIAHKAGDTALARTIADRLDAAEATVKDTPNLELRLPFMDKGLEIPGTGGDVANFAAGMGQRVASAGRGLRQFAAERGIGDKAAADKAVREAQALDSALMETGAGKAGAITTDLLTGLAPVPGAQAGLLRAGAAVTKALPKVGASSFLKMAAVPARGAVEGGLYGLAEEVDRERGETRADKIKGAALGGAAGQTAVAGLGRVITPMRKLDPERIAKVMRLDEEGIPVSLAQASGNRFLESVEGGFAANPLLSMFTKAGSPKQKEAVSRAIGKRLDVDDVLNEQTFSDAVDNAGSYFKKLEGAEPGKRTSFYTDDLINIVDDAEKTRRTLGAVNAPGKEQTAAAWQRRMDEPEITGKAYNDTRSILTKEANRLRRAGDTHAADVVTKLRNLEDDEAQRLWGQQGIWGNEASDIGKGHKQWSILKDLEKPGVIEPGGGIDPMRLSKVVRARNPQAFMAGKGDDYQTLAQAMGILKPLGQGSTTTRNYLVNAALLGGGGSALYNDPAATAGYGGAGALALLLSQNKYARKAITNKLLATPAGKKALLAAMRAGGVAGAHEGAVENWGYEE